MNVLRLKDFTLEECLDLLVLLQSMMDRRGGPDEQHDR
jgi:hypothetical protein